MWKVVYVNVNRPSSRLANSKIEREDYMATKKRKQTVRINKKLSFVYGGLYLLFDWRLLV